MSQGYGICGARRTFSSKVKLGNWIEDEFAQIEPIPVPMPQPESREAFINPKAMIDKQGPLQEPNPLVRGGLTSEMMFSHRQGNSKPDHLQPKIGAIGWPSTVAMEKRRYDLANAENPWLTEAHAASSKLPKNVPPSSTVEPEALPVFHRRKIKCYNNVFHL